MADNDIIYLDYQATTPTDPRVVEAMLPFFNARFGNPHSSEHVAGWRAEEAVEKARGQVARLIGAEPREIVFTSGATEANNLAIKGLAHRMREAGRNRVVTSAVEHKCVLESCRYLERNGFAVAVLPVDGAGMVKPADVARAIGPETALVSIMTANNEIGVIEPAAEIGAVCRGAGVPFHTDAAQALGKTPFNVDKVGCDFASLSAHKVYGPMGAGALYVRRGAPAPVPLFDGGGQENGLRSGTLPLPLCVGFGAACEIAGKEMEAEVARLGKLRDALLHRLQAVGGITINGDPVLRLSGNLNIAIDGIEAEDLIAAVPELAISTGSACTSAEISPSHVLRAIGLNDENARRCVRIGLGRYTTDKDVKMAAAMLCDAIAALRA